MVHRMARKEPVLQQLIAQTLIRQGETEAIIGRRLEQWKMVRLRLRIDKWALIQTREDKGSYITIVALAACNGRMQASYVDTKKRHSPKRGRKIEKRRFTKLCVA